MSTAARRSSSRYSLGEISGLVEHYIDLQPHRTRDAWWFRLMDLERAIKRLPQPTRQVLFLYGIAQQTTRSVGETLGVSRQTVLNRYDVALLALEALMNGDTP